MDNIKNDNLFWDSENDGGWVNAVLKFCVETRMWYLKTDLKVRLKRFITLNGDFDEVINLWKRLNIIKKDFGVETGGVIIRQALQETTAAFHDPEWEEAALKKTAHLRKMLNDDSSRMI